MHKDTLRVLCHWMNWRLPTYYEVGGLLYQDSHLLYVLDIIN